MTKVKTEVAALGLDSWTQNLYWSWLYSFQPLIAPKGSAYPPFMQTQAWTRKDLQTALGSWTELKHDTILYAKQVMAEMGGGGEPRPAARLRGTEPGGLRPSAGADPDDLRRAAEPQPVERPDQAANLENLISELTFLKDISERELAGEAITDDEYWHIQYWGGTLEQFTLAAADTTDGMSRDLSDQKAALVADVATGHR